MQSVLASRFLTAVKEGIMKDRLCGTSDACVAKRVGGAVSNQLNRRLQCFIVLTVSLSSCHSFVHRARWR
ncbi:hypothetical protein ABVT39_024155 [Epinephelus coioides]